MRVHSRPNQRLGGTWKQKPLCRLIPSLYVLCLCVRESPLRSHPSEPGGTQLSVCVRCAVLPALGVYKPKSYYRFNVVA